MKLNLKNLIKSKKGAAGLIVAIIVLSYMMMISSSQFRLLQLEATGHSAKSLSKKAYFCAFSGLQFALERLRANVASTATELRPYFGYDSTDYNTRWDNELGTGFADPTTVYINDVYVASPAFTISSIATETVEPDARYIYFRLNTYPHSTDLNEYWVKVQGYYKDPVTTKVYSAQLVAIIKFEPSNNQFRLKKFKQMAMQTTTIGAGTDDDFWDWQYLLQ